MLRLRSTPAARRACRAVASPASGVGVPCWACDCGAICKSDTGHPLTRAVTRRVPALAACAAALPRSVKTKPSSICSRAHTQPPFPRHAPTNARAAAHTPFPLLFAVIDVWCPALEPSHAGSRRGSSLGSRARHSHRNSYGTPPPAYPRPPVESGVPTARLGTSCAPLAGASRAWSGRAVDASRRWPRLSGGRCV